MTDRSMISMTRLGVCAALMALVAASACGDKPDAAPKAAEAEHSDEHGEGEEHAEEEGRVTLSEAAHATAGIRVEPVGTSPIAASEAGLQVPGQVEFEPERVAMISPRVGGRIERLTVVEGDRVGGGQTVALISSPAFLTAQNDLVQATRRAEMLRGTQDEGGARALVEAAQRRLRLMGVGSGVISRVASTGEISPTMFVGAPFGGSIIEALALAGQAVEPGTPLFKIADLSSVDVVAEVPERAMPMLRIGQRATLSLAAYPTQRFEGRVERLRDQLDPTTRTIRAVIHVANPERALRPGMFANVTLDAPALAGSPSATTGSAALTVPESALVTDGDRRYVFVEVGTRTYERREVLVESISPPGSTVPAGARVVVRSGLSAGDRVVVTGAFTLKSEMGKAGFSHEH